MINNVTLIGRLTATPELRQTTTGKTVVSFCIAVERRFDRATSDFINIVAWNKTAEFVSKYFAKGDLIAQPAEGKLGACIHASISGTVKAIADGCISIEK